MKTLKVSDFPKDIFEKSAGVHRGKLAEKLVMDFLPGAKDIRYISQTDILWKNVKIEVRSRMAEENKAFFNTMSADTDSFFLVLFSLKDDLVYFFFIPKHDNSKFYLSENQKRWQEFMVSQPEEVEKIIEKYQIGKDSNLEANLISDYIKHYGKDYLFSMKQLSVKYKIKISKIEEILGKYKVPNRK